MSIQTDRMVQLVTDSTKQVFEMMMGIQLTAGEHYTDRNDPGPMAGVVSLVGLVGSWVGTGSFTCGPEMACQLASSMLMAEYKSINEEVLDAVAEVTNMIVGNVKTGLEEDLGPMGLSIPTVIFGRNFMTRSVGNSEWTVVPFFSGNERIEVQICLAPHKASQTVPRFWMAGIHS
jgi:chemotaxis protein CheX